MTTEPRTELHARITAAISERIDLARGGSPATVGELADAVMTLFVDVRPSPWLRAGYVIADLREGDTQ